MMRFPTLGALLGAAALCAGAAQAAEPALYETGPAQDSSFIRFIDAGAQGLEVTARGSQARLTLDSGQPASPFMAVGAGKPVQGSLRSGQDSREVSVSVEPGQFVSVIATRAPQGGLETVVLHEQPDDFNALRASVAFYNLDAQCPEAALQVAGRDARLFENVAHGQAVRRQVNPVALSLQALCGGQPSGEPLQMGTLAAGERYTVILARQDGGARLFHVIDSLGN
ncbi:alginate O-acetyltransferase AlgF [Orrella sp. JC864]|uniref:alginate O-acetyltransferase AlgF n=1 Tax=Orrella sp. JC864 TaxID=3120298 RepID=UPI0030085E3E